MGKAVILGRTTPQSVAVPTSSLCLSMSAGSFSFEKLNKNGICAIEIYIYVYFNTCGQMLQVV